MGLAHALDRETIEPEYRIRVLGPEDAGDVLLLHQTIYQSLERKEFMYPRGLDFFRQHASARGRIIGISHEGELVAYAALRNPAPGQSAHAKILYRLQIAAGSLAEGAGGGVSPTLRRAGLFAWLIRERNRMARRMGFRFHSSVVSPANEGALATLLQEGFFVAARFLDNDGENYLVLKDLHGSGPLPAQPGLHAAISDVPQNLAYLRQGLYGFPARFGAGLCLRYRRIGDGRPRHAGRLDCLHPRLCNQ